ncbi:MAG TPA: ferritin-like domain-containing protein, partial [Candidatus Dormibacteraeota bacterium]|nr:ferritin-like domain-containing protein [Candidatus Dormibacteraeota bacterium]
GLFVGSPQAQATPDAFHLPGLIAVTGLESAVAAVNEIIEQGEGARGDWQTAHYGRFLDVYDDHLAMRASDPNFEAARPVLAAFESQPFDVAEPQPLITDPTTGAVADLFNMGYEVLLQTLTRYFTHTDESPEQLSVLTSAALGLMTGVLRRLGNALTRLPVGAEYPGRTAGPTFQMYYQMGNFVPWRDAAWTLLRERMGLLADRCSELGSRDGIPSEVASAAGASGRVAERLAAQLTVDH